MWRTLDDSVIARDEHGNAKGGIRLPDIEVPLARWYGATKKNRLGGASQSGRESGTPLALASSMKPSAASWLIKPAVTSRSTDSSIFAT